MHTLSHRSRGARGVGVFILALGAAACQGPSGSAPASAQSSPPPLAAAIATPPLQRGRTLIDSKTMTLKELVDQADRIIVGKIEDVNVTTAELSEGGRSTTANVREVVVRVERALKGTATEGQTVRVRQLLSLSAPLTTGETVMWFLPADSPLGLTQPLGLYSGDFRIDTDKPERPAVNLKQNAGLWEDSLWVGEGFERARVLGEAATTLKLALPARARIDNAAARDPLPSGVPLDLLVSATLSQVKK